MFIYCGTSCSEKIIYLSSLVGKLGIINIFSNYFALMLLVYLIPYVLYGNLFLKQSYDSTHYSVYSMYEKEWIIDNNWKILKISYEAKILKECE